MKLNLVFFLMLLVLLLLPPLLFVLVEALLFVFASIKRLFGFDCALHLVPLESLIFSAGFWYREESFDLLTLGSDVDVFSFSCVSFVVTLSTELFLLWSFALDELLVDVNSFEGDFVCDDELSSFVSNKCRINWFNLDKPDWGCDWLGFNWLLFWLLLLFDAFDELVVVLVLLVAFELLLVFVLVFCLDWELVEQFVVWIEFWASWLFVVWVDWEVFPFAFDVCLLFLNDKRLLFKFNLFKMLCGRNLLALFSSCGWFSACWLLVTLSWLLSSIGISIGLG